MLVDSICALFESLNGTLTGASGGYQRYLCAPLDVYAESQVSNATNRYDKTFAMTATKRCSCRKDPVVRF
jgi:hypothetical protein